MDVSIVIVLLTMESEGPVNVLSTVNSVEGPPIEVLDLFDLGIDFLEVVKVQVLLECYYGPGKMTVGACNF